MIAPDVLVLDMEPDGFAWLCDLARQRQSKPSTWGWVVHRAGKVVTSSGMHLQPGSVLPDDLDRAPAALLERSGLERVVMLDAGSTHELAQALDQVATPSATQFRLFAGSTAAFWGSPAVRTAPAPPTNPWEAVEAWLGALGHGRLVLAVYDDAGDLRLSLVAEVNGGVVTKITSSEGAGVPSVSRSSMPDLLAHLEMEAPVTAALACSSAQFESMMADADLPAAALALADGGEAIYARGLPRQWTQRDN